MADDAGGAPTPLGSTTPSARSISLLMGKSPATRSLHKILVSPLLPTCRLTVLFDCCHSGSALELPYIYRPDASGQVNLLSNVRQAVSLAEAAANLVQGGFSMRKVDDAKVLLGGAKSFWKSLHHREEVVDAQGLAQENFEEDWSREGKDVWMFSGCADDQTSADTSIAGAPTGAMSWAFIGTMRANPRQSYINVLQNTRGVLRQRYAQIPQLSVGGEYDLNQMVSF
ncbi:hypothetical protein MMC08_008487 [Hypocenomyce scalaris]|nr:hypothetical protein [Hypocenomyce scalaris]